MSNFEYRLERLEFQESPNAPSDDTQLIAEINKWGRQGWRVVFMELVAGSFGGPPARRILLERPMGVSESERTVAAAGSRT
jgi:hypothetical protein